MNAKRQQLPAGFRNNTLVELHIVVSERLPQVYSFLVNQSADFEGLTVKPKDGGVLVIAKRVNGDGKPEVMFCGGYDTLAALADLDRALAAGNWKEDKPWVPPGEPAASKKK